MKRLKQVFILVLILGGCVAAGAIVPLRSRPPLLHVYFLDVGQGDAIFIDTPSGNQVLIDGGPDKKVLNQLGKVMPWWDKTIDWVIATHPDKDHIAGLPQVLGRFTVGQLLHADTQSSTVFADALYGFTGQQKVVSAGQVLMFDQQHNITFTILHPSDVAINRLDSNDASIIGVLTYGDTSWWLSGDASFDIEDAAMQKSVVKQIDILKLGHHGSHTSTSDTLLDVLRPSIAIASAECDNRYGHPHDSIISRLHDKNITMLSTCEDGLITTVSDGKYWWVK